MKYLFIFIIVCIVRQLNAQEVSITLEQQNVLFLGIENAITLHFCKINVEDIEVHTSNGIIKKSEFEEGYLLRPTKRGECIISIYNKKHELIQTFKYSVRLIGPFAAKLCSKTNGLVKKTNLQTSLGLEVFLDGFDFEVKGKVKSYKIKIISNCQTIYDEIIDSEYFTKEVAQKFSQLNAGDFVIITQIQAYVFDEKISNLNTIFLEIQ